MDDKILETKRKLRRIASDRKRNRISKYNDMKTIIVKMGSTSRIILHKEFRRDYELDDLLSHMGVLITISLTFLNLVITLLAAFFSGKEIAFHAWTKMTFILMVYVIFLMVLYSLYNIYVRNKRDNMK